jgi:hypothetical protein
MVPPVEKLIGWNKGELTTPSVAVTPPLNRSVVGSKIFPSAKRKRTGMINVGTTVVAEPRAGSVPTIVNEYRVSLKLNVPSQTGRPGALSWLTLEWLFFNVPSL